MISEMIGRLGSADVLTRQIARKSLVSMGQAAVSPLIAALRSDQPNVCWEAAKALGEIKDPTAATALVETMKNADGDVSWVAAEALTLMDNMVVIPVLRGLLKYSSFHHFRVGAHHVLSQLNSIEYDDRIQSVLDAIDNLYPEITVPVAAEKSLQEFTLPPLNSTI